MIKSSKDATKGTGLNFLTTPYNGPVSLKDMKVEKVGSVEDSLKIVFELKGEDVNGNSVSGIEHSHAIWAPDTSNDEDVQKKADMTVYIASRLVPKDKIEDLQAIEGSSWKEFANNVINFVRENGGFERTDISIKVPGSTYGGNFKVKFPGYKDFITNSEHAPLTWSNSELEENHAYLQGKDAKPDTEITTEGVDLDDADF